jgi:hypothetical protein
MIWHTKDVQSSIYMRLHVVTLNTWYCGAVSLSAVLEPEWFIFFILVIIIILLCISEMRFCNNNHSLVKIIILFPFPLATPRSPWHVFQSGTVLLARQERYGIWVRDNFCLKDDSLSHSCHTHITPNLNRYEWEILTAPFSCNVWTSDFYLLKRNYEFISIRPTPWHFWFISWWFQYVPLMTNSWHTSVQPSWPFYFWLS